MVSPLTLCPNGHVAENRAFWVDGSNNSIIGGGAPCPVCGEHAEVISGVFSDDRRGNVSAKLFLTPSQRERLKRSLSFVQQELAKPEPDEERAVRVLEATIEANAPATQPFLAAARAQFRDNPSGWIGVLIALISLFVSIGANQGISPDQLEQILDETVRSVQNEPAPTVGEAPMPPGQSPPGPEDPPTVEELPTPTTR